MKIYGSHGEIYENHGKNEVSTMKTIGRMKSVVRSYNR
jgi:hypothetical protein